MTEKAASKTSFKKRTQVFCLRERETEKERQIQIQDKTSFKTLGSQTQIASIISDLSQKV